MNFSRTRFNSTSSEAAPQAGFTLIELAIVIIIIGLLMGGVFMGQNLIRNSELNTALSEVERYRTAIGNFQDAYLALPGDMVEATSQWGEADATPATCIVTPSTGQETCNGNGDGKIGPEVAGQEFERFRAWQHMTNAGLLRVAGFTGVAGSGGDDHAVPGENVPEGAMTGTGYSLRFLGTLDNTDADFYEGIYRHILQFGGQTTTSHSTLPVLLPEEALSLDNKADDGAPATGKIRSYKSTSTLTPGCTTTDVSTTALYDATQNDALCSLIFLMGI